MTKLAFTELTNSPIEFRGALDFDLRKQGISPRRLPDWTRMQVPEMMEVMLRMPSGVRLAFTTSSRSVELHVLTTRMVNEGADPRPMTFDLSIDDGEPLSQSSDAGNDILLFADRPGEYELKRGDAYTVRFDELAAGEKYCQLWLPQNAFVELRSFSIEAGSSLGPPPAIERSWVHYGSSISHCMEAGQPTGVWPVVASRRGGIELTNLGFGGQCHLDQFVARTIGELPADLISIKVGINVANMDSMRERVFTPALHGFLDTLRERKPDTPVILVSPIYCPCAEEHPGPTIPDKNGKFVTIPGSEDMRVGCLTLTRMREIIADVVEKRNAVGDAQLHYLNGLELFSEKDAHDLPDDLHPNPAGYARMGQRFADRVFSGDSLLSQLTQGSD